MVTIMTTETATMSANAQDGFLNETDEFAFLLEEVPRVLRKSFDESIAQFGLSRTQWRTLAYLIKTEGMTQTELAVCLELERATIGLTIDHLEKLEFVERRSAEDDGVSGGYSCVQRQSTLFRNFGKKPTPFIRRCSKAFPKQT